MAAMASVKESGLRKCTINSSELIQKLHKSLQIERKKCSVLSSDMDELKSELKKTHEICDQSKRDVKGSLHLVDCAGAIIDSLRTEITGLERENEILKNEIQNLRRKCNERHIPQEVKEEYMNLKSFCEQKHFVRRQAPPHFESTPARISAPQMHTMSQPSTSKHAKRLFNPLKTVSNVIVKNKQYKFSKKIRKTGVPIMTHGAEHSCKCGKLFYSKSLLDNHLKNEGQERNFECHSCPRRFEQFGHLKRHMTSVHEIRGALQHFVGGCKLCGTLFRTQENRGEHVCPKMQSYSPTDDD